MAITVQQFAKAIRISVDDATGTALDDATRLLAYCDAAIVRYAGADVPDAIKDQAIVQLGQYLFDAPVAERSRPQSALANSGVKAMLAPYRVHRAGIDVDAVMAMPEASGLNRDEVIQIINETLPTLVEDWARADNDDPIPANKLINVPPGGLTAEQVQTLIDSSAKIQELEEFEQALRTSANVIREHLVNVAITNAAYLLAGNPTWPAAGDDREIIVTFRPVPGSNETVTFDLSTLLALPAVGQSQPLSASNAIEHTEGAVKYYFARTATNQILFSADSIGDYYLTINDHEIDVESFARKSSSESVPLAKRPTNAGNVTVTTGTLTHVPPRSADVQSALEAIDDAIIVASDLHDTSNLTNAQLQATDAFLLDDASVIAAGESQLKEISVSELDKRYAAAGSRQGAGLTQAQVDARVQAGVLDWAETGNTDPIPAGKLANAPSGGGLDQDAVDARVTAIVPSWARSAQRFNDEQRAVFEAFTGDDVWTDSTTVQVASQTSPGANPNVPGTLTFALKPRISPRQTNHYAIIRVPSDKVALVAKGLLRLAISDPPGTFLVSTAWTAVSDTDTANDYYTVQVANFGAGAEFKVEEFQPMEINPDRVDNFFVPESWARQGNQEPIPSSKVQVLNRYATERYDSVAAIAVADVTQNRRGLLTLFTDPLTLTESDHGLLLVGIQWRVPSSSAAQLAIDDDATDERNVAFHEITASTDYSASGDAQGIKIGEVDVWNVVSGARGTTKYGTVSFYVAKNSSGNVGFYFDYDADVGGVSSAGSIQASIEIYSLPSGAPSASGGGGGSRTVTLFDSGNFASNGTYTNRDSAYRTRFITELNDDSLLYFKMEIDYGPSSGVNLVATILIDPPEGARGYTSGTVRFYAPGLADYNDAGSVEFWLDNTELFISRYDTSSFGQQKRGAQSFRIYTVKIG